VTLYDLVLINPRMVGTDKYPPTSLLCLAAYARREGHSVVIIDAQAEVLTDEEVSERVGHYGPTLCGITFMTNQVEIVRHLVAKLKERNPGLKLVAGGIHASILPAEAKALGFDFCVVGEGEVTLVQLLSAIENQTSTDDIEGLWTSSSQYRPRQMVPDLDSLPLPAWDLVPVDTYSVSQPDFRYTLESGVCLTISTSRGCPYNCAFCCSHGVYGRSHRTRSPRHIADEIEMLYRKHDVRKFFLVDESILANPERAEGLADEILRRNLKIEFASSARVSDRGVNIETLTKMRKAGMVRVDFGVESGSQNILNDIRKGITIRQVKDAHRIAHEAGMRTTTLMIAGHLEEDWEDILDSLELVAKIGTDYPEFGPMTPYPGTEAYSKALEEGWIRDPDWSMYYISNPYRVMRSRHFLYHEIYALTLLCTDAAHFMIAWKLRKPSSWKGFYSLLNASRPVIGLKPIGRLWLARYMQTGNRACLRKLSIQQLKWPKTRDLFEHPEDMAAMAGLRKDPLKLTREPNKMRRMRLLMPLVLERVEDAVAEPLHAAFYACLLSLGRIRT
jgi:anaerobic magnesium-protoporphyrin IX monomethyl ester cyclase